MKKRKHYHFRVKWIDLSKPFAPKNVSVKYSSYDVAFSYLKELQESLESHVVLYIISHKDWRLSSFHYGKLSSLHKLTQFQLCSYHISGNRITYDKIYPYIGECYDDLNTLYLPAYSCDYFFYIIKLPNGKKISPFMKGKL